MHIYGIRGFYPACLTGVILSLYIGVLIDASRLPGMVTHLVGLLLLVFLFVQRSHREDLVVVIERHPFRCYTVRLPVWFVAHCMVIRG